MKSSYNYNKKTYKLFEIDENLKFTPKYEKIYRKIYNYSGFDKAKHIDPKSFLNKEHFFSGDLDSVKTYYIIPETSVDRNFIRKSYKNLQLKKSPENADIILCDETTVGNLLFEKIPLESYKFSENIIFKPDKNITFSHCNNSEDHYYFKNKESIINLLKHPNARKPATGGPGYWGSSRYSTEEYLINYSANPVLGLESMSISFNDPSKFYYTLNEDNLKSYVNKLIFVDDFLNKKQHDIDCEELTDHVLAQLIEQVMSNDSVQIKLAIDTIMTYPMEYDPVKIILCILGASSGRRQYPEKVKMLFNRTKTMDSRYCHNYNVYEIYENLVSSVKNENILNILSKIFNNPKVLKKYLLRESKNIESLFKINISLEPKKTSSPDKTIEVFKI
jgi:hypothetical protein